MDSREALHATLEIAREHVSDASSIMPDVHLMIQNYLTAELMAKSTGAFDAPRQSRPGVAIAHLDIGDFGSQQLMLTRPIGMDFQDMRYAAKRFIIPELIARTRIDQIRPFLQWQDEPYRAGYRIHYKSKSRKVTDGDLDWFTRLSDYLLNCGADSDPRQRRAYGRDDLDTFTAKHIRDTLICDACPVELIPTNAGDIHGFVAVDAARVYLTDPNNGLQGIMQEGWTPEFNEAVSRTNFGGLDNIFALYTKDGRPVGAYTHRDLLYPVRNPTSDENYYGYGSPEIEDLMRIATAFLNALTLNERSISDNSIPRGLMAFFGDIPASKFEQIRMDIANMYTGSQNRFRMPMVNIPADQGVGVQFLNTGDPVDEQLYARWITFLVAISCAMWRIDPSELNFESYSVSGKSTLGGDDAAEKIANSKDKGLTTLLGFYKKTLNEILNIIDPSVCLEWTGLNITKEDYQKQQDSILLYGEARQRQGLPTENLPELLKNAPMNPALISVYLQSVQQAEAEQQPEQTPQQQQPEDDDPEQQEGPSGERRMDDHEGNRWQVPHEQGNNGNLSPTRLPSMIQKSYQPTLWGEDDPRA